MDDKPFLCEYSYKGDRWSIVIHASSLEEAKSKLRHVSSGKVLGEVALEVSLPEPPIAWLRKLKDALFPKRGMKL